MGFEYDKHKSESNKEKHGIDFIEAQALWKDPDRIEIPARTLDEPRYLWRSDKCPHLCCDKLTHSSTRLCKTKARYLATPPLAYTG